MKKWVYLKEMLNHLSEISRQEIKESSGLNKPFEMKIIKYSLTFRIGWRIDDVFVPRRLKGGVLKVDDKKNLEIMK